MKSVYTHDWNLTVDDALELQSSMAPRVVRRDCLPADLPFVAGVDVAYEKDGDRLFASVVVLDATTLETIETAVADGKSSFPYIPGLFSFRELPLLCTTLENLRTTPELIICDGQGIAHQRRFGLASHLGVLFDVPTIGCGKTRLIGEYRPPPPNRGDFTDLIDADEVIGSVLCTRSNVKPVFLSIGHRVSLPTARDWILRLTPRFRLPEPIRRANEMVNSLRHARTVDTLDC